MAAKKIASLIGAAVILLAGIVLAQESNITFPVAELGGCGSKTECKQYCDIPENLEPCLSFAEKNGLMSREEAAKKMIGKTGPGGCRGKECKNYCENPDNMDECIAFAEENGLMPPEELERAKKMRNVVGPGGCRGKECKTYCDDPVHEIG